MRGGVGSWRGLAVCSVLGALTAACLPPAQAAAPVAAEKSLLGIRILQTYRDVFRRYGPPNRVYRNGEMVELLEAYDSKGKATGGILGLADDTQNAGTRQAGYPGMGGGMPGFPGMPGGMMGRRGMGGGMPGYPGAPGGMARRMMGGAQGGMPGAYPGMPGGMTRPGMGGGMPGYPGAPGGMSGIPGGIPDLPGFPGAGGAGMPGGMMRPGMGGGMPGTASVNPNNPNGNQDTFAASGGYIWVYFYPKKQLVYEFVFNADNRVEIIMERGRAYGQTTARNIGLGTPLRSIYKAYGWPDSLEQQGQSLALYYNQRYHAYFSVLNNKVNGIAVFLRENQRVRYEGGQGPMNGAGMMGRPGGGMPGYPGMPGGMMGGRGRKEAD